MKQGAWGRGMFGEEIQVEFLGTEVGPLLCPRTGQEASVTQVRGEVGSAGVDVGEEMGSGSCSLAALQGCWVLAMQ